MSKILTKKAAMFGLDTIIKKLCHTGLDPVSNGVNAKHGAMFGLDARIALAIFGALSVISGAALYSAIQQSKVVAIVNMMNEFGKAYEQYVLDTGSGLPANSEHPRDVNAQVLVINSENLTGWQGPYLSYDLMGLSSLLINSQNIDYGYFIRAGIDDWTSGSSASVDCDGTRICYIWVSFRLITPNEALVKALDTYIDNADGIDKGKLRYANNFSYVRYLVGPSMRKTQN